MYWLQTHSVWPLDSTGQSLENTCGLLNEWHYLKSKFCSRNCTTPSSGLMHIDTCKHENQTPFELIRRASKYLRKSKLESLDKEQVPSLNDEAELYRRWEQKWKALAVREGVGPFMDLHFYPDEKENPFPVTNSQHIVGLVYDATCGREGMQRTWDASENDQIRIDSISNTIDSFWYQNERTTTSAHCTVHNVIQKQSFAPTLDEHVWFNSVEK